MSDGVKGKVCVGASVAVRLLTPAGLCQHGGTVDEDVTISPPLPTRRREALTTTSLRRFFLCEVLCLVVVVGNIYFTDLFLGGTFLTYGTEVISFPDMDPEKRVDPMTRIFPRVTKCTFRKFGSSGTIETHDTMCVLAVNIINEKIFIFIWFWLVILTTITAGWLVYRLLIILSSDVRFRLLQVCVCV
ncbi:Innexin inx2 [Chionoecetes opilio]|uniref:Innexin n=1 Tax=Chionoecetes opilio TaxID=41210 RepID=A0A8J4YHY9_CHIOP|nr:Innexin inx2 [Chionoecetes opilio]